MFLPYCYLPTIITPYQSNWCLHSTAKTFFQEARVRNLPGNEGVDQRNYRINNNQVEYYDLCFIV